MTRHPFHTRPSHVAALAILVASSVCPLRAALAQARDPSHLDDDDARAPLSDLPRYEVPFPDLVPGYVTSIGAPMTGNAALSVVVAARQSWRGTELSGSLVLELPFDGFASSKAKRGLGKTADEPSRRPTPTPDDEAESSERGQDEDDAADRPTATWRLPRISSSDIRDALRAADKHRSADDLLDELGSLGARARWSSVLPTLRLRATRLIDESVSLSPTSYDAERTTTRGGASLWLEARATWSLDRLVFATEEVRVTQLKIDTANKQRKVSEALTAKMFTWQRSVYAMHDPTLPMEPCVRAWMQTEQLGAELDIATGGWFGTWKVGKTGPTPACVEAFQSDATR